jgi:hypothetical protein
MVDATVYAERPPPLMPWRGLGLVNEPYPEVFAFAIVGERRAFELPLLTLIGAEPAQEIHAFEQVESDIRALLGLALLTERLVRRGAQRNDGARGIFYAPIDP